MQKNNYFRYAATLAIICLAASGLLSVVFNITQPKILEQQSKEEAKSLKDVYPAASEFEPVKEGENVVYYKAFNKDKDVLGYVFKASKKGYSSMIVTMVGMDTKGNIVRIKVLSQNETPGLGSKINEVIVKETLWDILLKKAKMGSLPQPWFEERFNGKKAADLSQEVDTITGATISSKAVIDSVQSKAKEIMEKVQNGR
ncbi:MAG: RnfABCDGE type electron transport complex subunit G [Candidatus Omnitrophota bacterium]